MKLIQFLQVSFLQVSLLLTLLLLLSGCSSYRSNFGCGDAKGLNCRPLSIVDKQITNGQIEEIEQQESKSQKSGSCKGIFCNKSKIDSFKPDLRLDDNWHDFDEFEQLEDFDGLAESTEITEL